MHFTDIFIKRPVLSIVVSLIIIIAGIQATQNLNVRQYPRNENATITINTVYVGADAELVMGFVTTPLERAIASADGIEYLKSQSVLGLSTITARLKLNYPPNKALSEISAKVDQVRNDLPPEAEVPSISVETADSEFATAYLSFTSNILEQNQITDYLTRVVQPRLTSVPGVQRAEILGPRTFAIRAWLYPEKMAALNITATDVRNALARNNVLTSLGRTRGSYVQVNLTADTDLTNVEDFRQLVVREDNGTLIRLDDIADVAFGAEDYDTVVQLSGETSTFIGIWPLPNANALDVITLVRAELEELEKELPAGLETRIGYDSTEYIDSAINEVVFTLLETLFIVIIVIFLFMGSLRTALIPVIAIPISLIGAIFLMQLFGFTINLLSLLAIVLAVGLVVDDAIIVVENIERNIGLGKKPIQAALIGTRELVGPVIATTITLAAAYLPIAFQGGLTGSLFKEFAVTLAGAVIVSTVIALTLSPMLSSRLLKSGISEQGFALVVSGIFEKLKNKYGALLRICLNSRPAIYLLWIAFSLLCLPLFKLSPAELAPEEDQGVVFGIVNASSNATVDQNVGFAEQVKDIFMSPPETDFTFQITYPTGGFSGAVLKPWDQRERDVFAVKNEIEPRLMGVPGIEVITVTPPSLPGGGVFPVEFFISSTAEISKILEFAKELQMTATMSGKFAFPPIVDVKNDQPQTEVIIDKDKVAELGLTLSDVSQDLSTFYGGNFVNRFSIDGRSYKVIPQIKRENRLNTDQLTDIYVTGPNQEVIPLSTIATLKNKVTPRSLQRFQQLNSVSLSGVCTVPLADALTFLEEEAAKILPRGYVLDYTGESRQLRNEGNKFLPAFILSVLLIFLVLAVQFNSFRDPFVILAGSVPLAMFGALIFTFLKMPNPNSVFWTDGWTTTLNIYSQVGLVTLIGLIAKNGILIVEFANVLQQQGMSKLAAVQEASETRLRPILMTGIATVAGHFPLILVTGAGAGARNSIGLVLVGGMTIGTFFTLFVVPCIYMLIAKTHRHEES